MPLKVSILVSLMLALAASCARDDAPDLRIAVAQGEGAAIDVSYEFRRPQREMAFNAVAGGYRAGRWRLPPGLSARPAVPPGPTAPYHPFPADNGC